MAGIALDLPMFSFKCIVSVVIMVKDHLLPSLVIMATLAFAPVTPFMAFFLVNFLVASITGQRGFLIGLVLVTILALNISMFAAKQGKLGLFVIKPGVCPLFLVVAAFALGAKVALVPLFLIVLFVAIIAKLRRLPIFGFG